MLRARLVPLGVAAALLLALIAVFAVPTALPGRTAAQAGCTVGTQLVANPGFEDPTTVLAPSEQRPYTPPGWAGSATVIRNGDFNRVGDGFLYLLNFPSGLTQTLPTAALGGATLYVEYITYPGSPTQIQVGSQVVPVTRGQSTAQNSSYYNGAVTLPATPGDLTLTISPYEIDRLFITVGVCGTATATATATNTATASPTDIPTSTATATPSNTATTVPTATATATTQPTATATTQPTATATSGPSRPTATLRPTTRPRLNPTFTPVPSQPTVRPTARPRG